MRTIGHPEIIATRAAGHVSQTDHLPRLNRRKTFADQVEVGDAVDLVVIGDARVAIAEADLRPHIELDRGPAVTTGRAAEGAACGPAVAREAPRDLLPA